MEDALCTNRPGTEVYYRESEEAAEVRAVHNNRWNGVNGSHQTHGNHLFDMFDTTPPILFQPLPQARFSQLRCRECTSSLDNSADILPRLTHNRRHNIQNCNIFLYRQTDYTTLILIKRVMSKQPKPKALRFNLIETFKYLISRGKLNNTQIK